MIKTRDQSIFDEMFKRSRALGFTTYDYKPGPDTNYPFVEIESTDNDFNTNKTDIKGSVILVMSVWGSSKQRKLVSDMASAIFNEALKVKRTDGYAWSLKESTSGFRLATDNSVKPALKRGLLTLEFKIR